MSEKKRSFNTKNIILALILLVAANTIMGTVLALQSRSAMRTQISERMLDISESASYMINGDVLQSLTKEDAGTPAYEEQMDILRAFQDNIELSYIYGINSEPDGTFTFTIDPAVEDPGEFGSPIVSTDALRSAANGVAAVDDKPYEDEWGKFYSAYSPVFNSDGKVAGIIAVDFSADWYEKQLSKHVYTIFVISIISLLSGIWLAIGVAGRIRKRFATLESEMKALDDDCQKLSKLMMKNSIKKMDMMPDKETVLLKTLASGETYGNDESGDEISDIAHRLHTIQDHLHHYLNYIESQTYQDEMTGVNNKAAYKQTKKSIDEKIAQHTAKFVISFFDINDLDSINTNYGFEKGDELLFGAAAVLKSVYLTKNVYRIASDEFIAISEEKTLIDAEDDFKKLDEAIKKFNSELGKPPYLSIAKGFSVFKEGVHTSYRETFIKAADAMHKDKADYHSKNSDNS